MERHKILGIRLDFYYLIFVLTIEYNALRKVHGTIQMESKENVGTTFRIILPLQIDPNPFVTRSRA